MMVSACWIIRLIIGSHRDPFDQVLYFLSRVCNSCPKCKHDASNDGVVATVMLEYLVSHMPAKVFSCFDRDQSGEISLQDTETSSSWRCREVATRGVEIGVGLAHGE